MDKKKYWLLFSGLLILILYLAFHMWMLHANQQLWGHLPLFLFVGSWILIKMFLARKRKTKNNYWYLLGLSSLSGILLSVGFPPLPLPFIMFIGFVPLFMAQEKVNENKKSNFKVWSLSYNTFVIWNILTTYWVANTAFVAGIIAIWLNAFFMSVPFMAYQLGRNYFKKLNGLALISFWLSFEYLHLNWEISWPWLNLGNAFASVPSLVQWYEYTGTFGGSLWILVLNLLVFRLWKQRKQAHFFRSTPLFSGAAVLLVPLVFSFVLLASYKETGRPVETVVVQPNFEPHYEKFDIPDRLQVERFIQLSRDFLTDSTRYLVFPETSFGLVDIQTITGNPEIKSLVEFLKNYPNLNLITGVNSYKMFKPGEPSTYNTRQNINSQGDTVRWELYNGAIQLNNDRRNGYQHYKKSKFVPGAEILPYRKLLFFLEPLVEKLQGSMSGHGMQEKRTPFTSHAGSVGPAICYESVFGDYFRNYFNEGAEAVFIMTNDGWWDKTAGHEQHLQFACLRAIETRKDIARSANTGISAFIDQKGRIFQPTLYRETTAIRQNVLFNDKKTFYTTWGDFIGRISLLSTLILLLNVVVKAIIRNNSE